MRIDLDGYVLSDLDIWNRQTHTYTYVCIKAEEGVGGSFFFLVSDDWNN